MIKTKEEWERVKVVADAQSGPSLQHAVDTIEALREVARAGANINHKPPMGRRMFRCSHCDKETPLLVDRFLIEVERVESMIDALPDWLTDG